MKKVILLLFVLCSFRAFSQSQTLNTSTVTLCTCAGDVWNIAMPFKPSVTFTAPGLSKKLMFTNYGFNIPASATITGVEVNFTYTTTAPSNSLRDTLVMLLNSGFLTGVTQETLTGFYNSPTNSVSIGGIGNMWGWGWTPALINSVGFGFNFKLVSDFAGTGFGFVNGASITVFYDLPSGLKESQQMIPKTKVYNTHKLVTLSSENTEASEVIIYSVLGAKLMTIQLDTNSKKEIDFSDFNTGIYVYTLKQGSKQSSGKFILD